MILKKYLPLLLLLLLSIFSGAQLTPTMLLLSPDSNYKQSQSIALIHGNGLIGSNSMDIAFLKRNFYGGHISKSSIDKIADDASVINRAGFLANGSLDFYSFSDSMLGKSYLGLRIGVSTNYHASLSYSRNLFKTIYQGNAQFAGNKTQLAPLAATNQAWQKFSVGMFNKSTLTSVSLALVAGQRYNSLLVHDASMYTSTMGDTLSLSYVGDYIQSDTLKRGWANGSGLGLCLDADYNLPLADHQGVISIALRDFGFVAWNKQTEHYNFDSLTTWTGVEVNSVFDLNTDSLNLPNMRDSLKYNVTNKTFVAPLPLSLHVRFSKFFTATDYYEIGVSIWPNRAAIPLVYAGMNHFIGKHFIFSEKISYGGYGTWGIGAEMQYMPCGSWLFKLGTNHLGGFTMGSAHSRDVAFTVGKVFSKPTYRQPEMEEK
jgi:hypothetical protein